MAALTRVLQKIFGETGDTAEFGQVGSDSAGSPTTTKNLDTIQSLSQYAAGLFAITANLINPPRGEDFNALLYLITAQLKYLFQSGVPEWIATENYYANKSFVIGSNGNIYKALTGTDGSPNINHNPVGDTTNWAIVWDKTNDGAGSGLDADNVRGYGLATGSEGSDNYNTLLCTVKNVTDANNITGNGIVFSTTNNPINFPTVAHYAGIQFYIAFNVSYKIQIAHSDTYGSLYLRSSINGVWSAWNKLWHSGNDGAGSGLDADIVRGTTPGTRGLQYLAAAAVSNIAALILSDLKTVDGSGSGLDADLLDGVQGSGYARVNTETSVSATNFPIGTHVFAERGTATDPKLNSSVTVYKYGSDYKYSLEIIGTVTALSGTWRSCGAVDEYVLLRRVA